MPSTTFRKNAVLGVTRGTSYAPPANWFLALFTASPTPTGSIVSELTIGANGYTRQTIAASGAAWDATADTGSNNGRFTQNTNAVSFTFTGSAGTASHWGLMDASTAGTMHHYSTIDVSGTPTPQVTANGVTITFPAGSLDLIERDL